MQAKFGKSPAPGHVLRIVQDYTKEEVKAMAENIKTAIANSTAAKQDAENTQRMMAEALA